MKSGSSAFIGVGSQSAPAAAMSSSYHRSRPSCISQGSGLRFTTMHFSMLAQSGLVMASSAMAFSPICLPERSETLDVMSILQEASPTRVAMASALKPPNTMEWMAPIRVQASITMGSSMIIGR
ncbi:MAG: hypothetical protein BWX80_04107 [Candidatus Hydrogenedentes bacterium ADurb.Bin101]|nr:MAG: hypothetical protein BWX80_04107 [Candidatus Hydrogenedentes bacterium ADurb.Bin101]